MTPEMFKKLKAKIRIDEGCQAKMYVCSAGYNTVGFGFNMDSNELSQKVMDLMLEEDADYRYNFFLRNYSWFEELDENRQIALVDAAFMGTKSIQSFKRMLKAFETKDYKAAALELLDSKYAKQVGERAKKLALMIEMGVYIL